jgi:plasmid stability protein
MAKITIYNVSPELEAWLNRRASERGCSVEEEIQHILTSVQKEETSTNLAQRIQDLFVPLGGVELPEIPREPMREPPYYQSEIYFIGLGGNDRIN